MVASRCGMTRPASWIGPGKTMARISPRPWSGTSMTRKLTASAWRLGSEPAGNRRRRRTVETNLVEAPDPGPGSRDQTIPPAAILQGGHGLTWQQRHQSPEARLSKGQTEMKLRLLAGTPLPVFDPPITPPALAH